MVGSPAQDDAADRAAVTSLLGREPEGDFEVVVRDAAGSPVVIRNAPLLNNGRPMPTRYWLVGAGIRASVGTLESSGGVRRAEEAVGLAAIAEVHERYAAERDAAIPEDHAGPRPSGGVGGTRRGVKCLHAHYAYFLAGGDDPVGAWVQEQLGEQFRQRSTDDMSTTGGLVAAIDCGTNSTRLLISDGTRTLVRQTHITRLGAGVDHSHTLDPEAIARVVAVLDGYRALLDEHDVSAIRMTATSAARDATNRDDFFDAAEAAIGVRPELLSGQEEAQLSFLGATAELDPAAGPYLVVDIGGGSTEFAFGAAECEAAISVDIGSVRLTEKYIESDPPLPEELVACLSITEAYLDDVVRLNPVMGGPAVLVGLAGTVTTAAAVEIGLADYDRDTIHHFRLTKAAAEDVYRTLVTESLDERMENPGLEPERAEVIVGGMCILVRIMRYFGADECLVSESDILDGLVATMVPARSASRGAS